MKKMFAGLLLCVMVLAGCGAKEPPASISSAAPGDPGARAQAAAGGPSQAAPTPQSEAASQAGPESAGAASSTPNKPVPMPENNTGNVDITEKLFIAQTNDIYLNGDDYLGKTIRYEGMFKTDAEWIEDGQPVTYYVIRYGPGCCGYDSEAGFDVRWPAGAAEEWPAVDDWVEVVGTIKGEKYESGRQVLYVELSSLTVKQERGAEYVAT